jgi:hypothetical protein
VADRTGLFFIGLSAALIAACAASSDETPVPYKPPKECSTVSDCPKGTAACINSFCVAESCVDQDHDGAGVGPGCTIYDCDDNDPTVPGSEICGNNKDDDCDNSIDEGCVCTTGDSMNCGVADCNGTEECIGGVWGNCSGGVPAPAEICGNDKDENCNGQKDEGCCPAGENPCPGLAVCSSNGVCK